ncbi:hypothetical protein [Tropicimonas sp. IMCC34043]|uniref:hypothetical protein n=1 Tax=Tropicimonas sp. IMCC34043 TaxID=2248760 RepID=UPI0013005C4F|nr:hypothetical protein [Tropicimonas sp. IMCC34043]
MHLVIVLRTLTLFVCALSVATFFSRAVSAAEPQIKIAQPGQNITVWDGWNVNATIFVKIDGGPGEDCIKLWWIRMGINSDTWDVCDQVEVKINLPLIYGELRAGHFQRETAVAVSDNASVAYSIELCDRVIDC